MAEPNCNWLSCMCKHIDWDWTWVFTHFSSKWRLLMKQGHKINTASFLCLRSNIPQGIQMQLFSTALEDLKFCHYCPEESLFMSLLCLFRSFFELFHLKCLTCSFIGFIRAGTVKRGKLVYYYIYYCHLADSFMQSELHLRKQHKHKIKVQHG